MVYKYKKVISLKFPHYKLYFPAAKTGHKIFEKMQRIAPQTLYFEFRGLSPTKNLTFII